MAGAAQEVLVKDSASALAVSLRLMAIGTHNGIVHVLDFHGNRVKSYRSHTASINDIVIDSDGEFVATAAADGKVVIVGLTSTETYAFDLKRQMRAISLEPSFAKRSTRAFVCGGMAGRLVMHEKTWLGHKETSIHSGEGPIWRTSWRGTLIAWANDTGVKLYDTESKMRVGYIDRPENSPRAEMFRCTLQWRDDTTLLIAWADYIKLVRVRARPPTAGSASIPFQVEIVAVFQVDCMVAGIAPYPSPPGSFLIVSWIAPDNLISTDEAPVDRAEQRRKAAHRPELRIISRAGEELSSDVLNLTGYDIFGCNDYSLQPAFMGGAEASLEGFYVALSPKDIIIVKPRDEADHVQWLVERRRYADALAEITRLEKAGVRGLDANAVGRKYIHHLVEEGDFEKAAELCSKVFGQDVNAWEEEVFTFVKHNQLQTIIPVIPTSNPQLSKLVYEVILAHFLAHDREALLKTIKEWPTAIYDIGAVIVAVKSELDKAPSSPVLMDCLAELYILNRQPTLALPYFLRRRRPHVFDLIRENNLFTAVRDQALQLVEFDLDLEKQQDDEKAKVEAKSVGEKLTLETDDRPRRHRSIALLVDHLHSIPIAKVVAQLQARPYFLYLYLDALFEKDPQLAMGYAERQLPLVAEFAPKRLMGFLRTTVYDPDKAYKLCSEKDMVPEMVYLLGKIGDNKRALKLIIERLDDVKGAIEFAKERNDDDLWEELLRHSETRPRFIRGLLENVGPQIDPQRLIRRIKNGLEIPGLKEALIKILGDFNLQISLLGGCQRILNGDISTLSRGLQAKQTSGFHASPTRTCPVCGKLLFPPSNLPIGIDFTPEPSDLAVLFLCRHIVHAHCVRGGTSLPRKGDDVVISLLKGSDARCGNLRREWVGSKIAYAMLVRSRLEESCPVCVHEH
ncbi:vacuolar protein sorting-associated protein 41 [Clavulina sp. PMI_390]|nr:vacuolar protein sorting-associated protein 41 [Clavulina sp. PMI_390]